MSVLGVSLYVYETFHVSVLGNLCMSGRFHVRVCVCVYWVSVCMCMWKVSCESVCALGCLCMWYAEGVSYECVVLGCLCASFQRT